jgi:hypothetical protein
MFPETLPIADGAKLMVKVTFCPGGTATGRAGALRIKPLVDATACVRLKASVPIFAMVKVWLLLDPTSTFPKLRLVGLATFPDTPDTDVHPARHRAATNAAHSPKYARQ